MPHKYAKNTERAAECQRLVEELYSFQEELNEWEIKFVASIDDRLTKYGEGTFISDDQFDKLSEIYRRIIG